MSSMRRNFVTSVSALLAVAAVLVMLAGAYMARSGGALLPFRWVEVSGRFERVGPEQIRAAVAAEAARGFFFVDLAAVRGSALGLPWVAEAEVRKVWPDTLEISVRERQVLGRLGEDRLVDINGNVFNARGIGETRGLPLLDASIDQMPQLAAYYRKSSKDVERAGRQIVRAHLSPRGALELELDDGLQVHLGSHDQNARWQRLLASLSRLKALDPRPIAQVDLRYTNGYAVRYADAQSIATLPH